jgi:hypothetical protein
MKKLERLTKGASLSRVINAAIEVLEKLANITTAAPLELKDTGATFHLTLQPSVLSTRGGKIENCSGGTLLVLSHSVNQSVDWDRDVEDCPVSYAGDTLVYSPTAYTLTRFYRVCTWDRCGKLSAISAELSEVVFTAVECPCT